MNSLFSILLIFSLTILQAVILPSFPGFSNCFDLLIIAALFLSLISTHHGMIIALGLIGCMMDSISNVPFFFHVFSYISVYMIVHLVKRLIFKQSVFFLMIISFLGVMIQHVLIIFSIFVRQDIGRALHFDYSLLFSQALSGVIIIPPSIYMIQTYWNKWNIITKKIKKQMDEGN